MDDASELNAALAKAQGAFPPIPRSKNVRVQTRGGDSYSYSYAPLEAILSAVRPALTENGLALVQVLENYDGPALRTELRHASGASVGGSFPLNVPENPQALGSLLTYLRRYAITALLGIATEEDDDGKAAKPKSSSSKAKRPQQDDQLTIGAQVQQEFATLRALESELGVPGRDWTGWTRNRLGLVDDEIATAEHWRRALPILQEEETKLRAELKGDGK